MLRLCVTVCDIGVLRRCVMMLYGGMLRCVTVHYFDALGCVTLVCYDSALRLCVTVRYVDAFTTQYLDH